jgi:tetratricopeptide (TPR) repeat protein
MKTTTLTTLAFAAALGLRAQNVNVVSAYNYLQDGNYAKAAEYIEPAIANESTMGKEKTWRYRGDIYRMIAMGEDQTLKSQFPDALQKAIDSYIKARELDVKKENERANIQALGALQIASLNAGNDAFTAKNYDQAVACYENSERIARAAGQVDSLAAFNKALAYETKGDAAKAIEAYRSCLEMGYKKVDLYRFIAAQEKKRGSLDAAIAAVREGGAAFPGNKELIQDELAFLLDAGREAEVEPVVKAALEKDPCNATYHSILASTYEKKAAPAGAAVPADAEQWLDQAETSYKKAIECDPNFFDAYFNIGVLYNNRAATCYDKANAIKDNAQYNKAKAACDAIYTKATPYFEKAHQLRPDDGPTIQQLMKLYAKTSDQAKYDEMKAKLEALKGK